MDAFEFGQSRRGAGRTERMIAEAQRLVDEDTPVNVVFAHDGGWSRRFRVSKDLLAVKVVIGLPDDFDWETMRPRSCSTKAVWLVDHAVVEGHPQFNAMMRAATRWDQPRYDNLFSGKLARYEAERARDALREFELTKGTTVALVHASTGVG